MEELLPFIILWIIITIFNLISKRLKKSRKSVTQSITPAPTSTPKGEIPPLLQELLGASTREKSPVIQNREKFEEDEEEIKDKGESLPKHSKESLHKEDIKDLLEKEEAEGTLEKKIYGDIQDGIGKNKLSILKKRSLKKAIIWKEILDKPISIKRIRQGRNIFLK